MVEFILVLVLLNSQALIEVSVLQQAGECAICDVVLWKLITMGYIYDGHIHNVLF